MEIKRILSGSAEFWGADKFSDTDYIVIREQDETFIQERDENECRFCYKPMKKTEYLKWLTDVNKWYLNNAPLVCREFLEYMNIDIFGKDKQAIHDVMERWFNFYRNQYVLPWNKYSYRIMAYVYFMNKGNFDLTTDELDVMLSFKRLVPDIEDKRMIYDFFGGENQL
jgi:hypothetical protein